jgi:cytochrome c1
MNSYDLWTTEKGLREKAERERDEARAALSEWEDAAMHVDSDHPDEKHCGCVPILRKQLKDARLSIKHALEAECMDCASHKQERDEAKAHLVDIELYGTDEINAAVKLRQKLASALVERDEARMCRDGLMRQLAVTGTERDQWRTVAHGLADAVAGNASWHRAFAAFDKLKTKAIAAVRWESKEEAK